MPLVGLAHRFFSSHTFKHGLDPIFHIIAPKCWYDEIGCNFCSYYTCAINYGIVGDIERLTRLRKQSLEALIIRFLCTSTCLNINF